MATHQHAQGRLWRPVPMEFSLQHNRRAALGLCDQELRAGFVAKVYGILTAQLLYTALFSLVCMFNAAAREYFTGVLGGPYRQYFAVALLVPTLCCGWYTRVNKSRHPHNYLGLFGFTTFLAVNVGAVCAVLQEAGLGLLVAEAALATAGLFLMLTHYAWARPRDFTLWGGALRVSLWALVGAGFAAVYLQDHVLEFAQAMFGAVLFSAYILYDTQCVLEKFDYDDYIVAALELYLDVINLFLKILKILVKIAGKKKK